MELEYLSTMDAANWLQGFKGDAYKQHRSVLSQIFDFARTKGWADSNPVTPTITQDVDYKKERKRLNLEQFNAIYA